MIKLILIVFYPPWLFSCHCRNCRQTKTIRSRSAKHGKSLLLLPVLLQLVVVVLRHRACFSWLKFLENACVLKNLHLGNLFHRIIKFLKGNAEIIRLSKKTAIFIKFIVLQLFVTS